MANNLRPARHRCVIKYAFPIPQWKAEQKQDEPETRKDHRFPPISISATAERASLAGTKERKRRREK